MIRKQLIDISKYDQKCPYAMTPIGICIHNTANDASAQNERDNVNRPENTASVSFHVAIDDKEAIQLIPFNRNAWHAGDGSNGTGNRKYIAIEICYSKSGGTRFIEAEKRSAKEVATLLKNYGWGISNIRKHQDFSGKYCPHRTLDMGWQRFLDMIKAELDGDQPTNELYRVRKSWADASSQLGAFSNFVNAIALCDQNPGYSVYNSSGTKVYPGEQGELYRVRRSWADSSSQLGAFSNILNAIALCDQNPGYSVYNSSGTKIYSA